MIQRDSQAQGKTNRRVAMFNGKRLSGWMALAVFATVGGAMVATDPAFAKMDVDNLTISGEVRERYEFRTNDTFNAGQGHFGTASFASTGGAVKAQKGNESGASQRIRVGVAYDLTPDVSFFAQMQDARSFGSECFGANAGGSSGAQCVSQVNSNQNGIDLHQGYVQVKNVLIQGLSLKAGRQEIKFGDHRLFGDFAWSQQGNAFDGVRLTQSSAIADLDVFWARIIDPSATAFQAGNNNIQFPAAQTGGNGTKVGAGQAGNNQDIYGAYLTLKPVKSWTIEPYYFLLQDARATQVGNTAVTAATGATVVQPSTFSSALGAQAPAQTRNFLGGRINGKAGAGVVMDFTYEGNYQFGSIASNCERNKTNGACGDSTLAGGQNVLRRSVTGDREAHINATQQAIKTGITFDAVPMKPRLGFEFDYASGDKCANVNAANTNGCNLDQRRHVNTADNLFPTNHFKYGAMDLMSWRNMVAYQFVFDVKPSTVSKFQVNYNVLRLASVTDNWYRAGQATYFTSKATNQAASLGQEIDLSYWHTFKEKFKFEIGYGHFFAGEYLTKSASGSSTSGPGAFSNTQGSFSNGFGNQTHIVGQNWGYVMGSILF